MKARLFGFCETARAIEAGRVASTTPSEVWHSKCVGSGRSGETCTCPCHSNGEGRCLDCGAPVVGRATCADRDACRGRAETDEVLALRRLRAESRAARIAAHGERRSRGAGGRCEHCGVPTAGGRFAPGHDAKLKGALIRAADQGDIEACAELMLRNWTPNGRFEASVESRAFDLIQADTRLWLQNRIESRRQEC